MGATMRGWFELNGSRLTKVSGFTQDGGIAKTKIIPVGATKAIDTNIPAETSTGSITIYGTDEDDFEFDYVQYCRDRSQHTGVRHFSASRRLLIENLEFTTYSAPIPTGDGKLEITVNWIASSADWE